MSEIMKTPNRFVGKRSTETVDFVGLQLEINKLNINQVLEIQDLTKKLTETGNAEQSSIEILSAVIRAGAPELRDLSKQEFQDFPMNDLAELSNRIMTFSGLA